MSNLPHLDRTKRVKDARTEAQKEIDEYKQQKEDEFKKFESEVSGLRSRHGKWRTLPITPEEEPPDARKLSSHETDGTGVQHSSGIKDAEGEANKDAETKLKDIKEAGKKNGPKVVDDLVTAVTDVKPEAPSRVTAPA